MGFPYDADTGLRTEILVGAWTDITPDTRTGQTVTISRGRSDYTSQADPTKVTLQLRNPDGRYTPQNPMGPYYGIIGRNTPLRISAAAGTPWLDEQAGAPTRVRASTPDHPAFHITGDIDVRIDLAVEKWDQPGNVVLMGRYSVAGNRSWRVQLNESFLQFVWSPDGTTTLSNAVLLTDGNPTPRMCVRMTLDVDNGSGGKTVRIYTGPTLDGPWVQFGADQVSAGTTSVFASTAPFEVGDVSFWTPPPVNFRVYGAQLRSGIDGAVVASPVFTAQAPGTTAFVDSAGRAWTATPGAITNRSTRAVVEVPSWPSRWGPSGRLVTATLNGAGILRRLRQGASSLDSTLRRRIASWPTVVAYWPFEDEHDATVAYSPLPSVRPATVTGAQFASDDTLAGSLALPVWPALSSFSCAVPAATSSSWQVQLVYALASAPGAYITLVTITTTGTVRTWTVDYEAGVVRVRGADADGNLIVDQPIGVGTDIFGPWTRQLFSFTQSGSTVLWHIAWLIIGVSGGAGDGSYTGTVGSVTGVRQTFGNFDNLRMGHVAVFTDADATAFDHADTGFSGESAAARAVRVCNEEGIPLTTPYGTTTSAVGPQRAGTALSIIQGAADADVGIVYEARDAITLAYRPRASLYNQTPRLVLDYAQQQVAPPLEPEDDDQQTRNDITVSRPAGSSARVTLDIGPLSVQAPPAGAGRYTDTRTINVATDDQLPTLAGWLLHLGTVNGVRYPTVTIVLHRSPELVDAALALDIGDRIQIINLPPWQPPGGADLIVQGITETIGVRTWTMTFVCNPAGPWTVGVVSDSLLGRLSPGGSATLATAATPAATSLSVSVSGGLLWPTAPATYPLDLVISGERVTLTGVSGTSSPQTFTVARGVNGISKTLPVNSVIELFTPSAVAL